jgi:hypothetical protein
MHERLYLFVDGKHQQISIRTQRTNKCLYHLFIDDDGLSNSVLYDDIHFLLEDLQANPHVRSLLRL